jgi:hypothetical protein
MKISELIETLQKIKDKHGDILVTTNAYPLITIEVQAFHYVELPNGHEREVEETCVELDNK